MTLIEKLESIGFLNLFTYRVGPCSYCENTVQTFYLPEYKAWLCEECYYKNQENVEFITFLSLLSVENNLSISKEQYDALMAKLQAQDTELHKLKASREDNVFVGTTDNLTLKYRAINPKAWGVPTKAQNGQGYFRCSDFPFNYDITPDRKFVRVFTAIPVTPQEADLFQQRYITQQLVVAKRRQSKEEEQASNATSQAFGPQPSAPATSPMQAPSAPAQPTQPQSRSFSGLPEAERSSLIAEAQTLVKVPGLFKDLQDALVRGVLTPKGISIP